MKTLKYYALAALCAFTLASCQPKEEKVLADYQSLIEQVEANGEEYTEEDWTKLSQEVEKISVIEKTCSFTDEQTEELGKKKGQLIRVIAEKKVKSLGKDVEGLINQGKGFLKGLTK